MIRVAALGRAGVRRALRPSTTPPARPVPTRLAPSPLASPAFFSTTAARLLASAEPGAFHSDAASLTASGAAVRLSKHLTLTGALPSRKKAEKIILGGRVSVNGDVVPRPAFLCFPGDVVKCDGAVLPVRAPVPVASDTDAANRGGAAAAPFVGDAAVGGDEGQEQGREEHGQRQGQGRDHAQARDHHHAQARDHGHAQEQVRLAKYLAQQGALPSRRAAAAAMREGRVSLNGMTATSPSTKWLPSATDVIEVDGARVAVHDAGALGGGRSADYNRSHSIASSMSSHRGKGRPVFLAYKLKGEFVHNDVDRQARMVNATLPLTARLRAMGVRGKPQAVGGIDFTTEGLVVLTEDTALKSKLERKDASNGQRFTAVVRGSISARTLRRLERGAVFEGGGRCPPMDVGLLSYSRGNAARGKAETTILEIVLPRGGGSKPSHQIRKALHHSHMWLKTLVRTQYGPYRLRGLRKGQVLEMDPIPPPSFDTREGGGAGGGAGGGGGVGWSDAKGDGGGDAGGRLNLNYDGESAADNEATSVATGQRLLLSQKAKSGRARVLGLQAWSDEGIELTELPRMPPSSKRN
jgi:16S rRNA U516 pseudouridylate synthase RsuA-like enzyme